MSGGAFEYKQYLLCDIADHIEWEVKNNVKYPPGIVRRFEQAVRTLRLAQAMAHRVDWLLSGDDSEATFVERWDQEVGR